MSYFEKYLKYKHKNNKIIDKINEKIILLKKNIIKEEDVTSEIIKNIISSCIDVIELQSSK